MARSAFPSSMAAARLSLWRAWERPSVTDSKDCAAATLDGLVGGASVRRVAISGQGTASPPMSDLGSLKAEWSRRHAHATAEVLHYETLLQSAREAEEIAELWQGLATAPVSHPAIRESRQ